MDTKMDAENLVAVIVHWWAQAYLSIDETTPHILPLETVNNFNRLALRPPSAPQAELSTEALQELMDAVMLRLPGDTLREVWRSILDLLLPDAQAVRRVPIKREVLNRMHRLAGLVQYVSNGPSPIYLTKSSPEYVTLVDLLDRPWRLHEVDEYATVEVCTEADGRQVRIYWMKGARTYACAYAEGGTHSLCCATPRGGLLCPAEPTSRVLRCVPCVKALAGRREVAAKPAPKHDHPPHYGGKDNPYEVIKVLRAWLSPAELLGFCKGNAIKYLARAGKKTGESQADDFGKAKWYSDYALQLEKAGKTS